MATHMLILQIASRAALIVNEILGEEVTAPELVGSPTDLLASELRSAVLHAANVHDLLGRTDSFFRWSRTDKARSSKNYMPIDDDFRAFTGSRSR